MDNIAAYLTRPLWVNNQVTPFAVGQGDGQTLALYFPAADYQAQ